MSGRKVTGTLLACVALVALVAHLATAELANKEVEEQQIVARGGVGGASGKLMAVPASLTRFFFYNSRPSERQAATLGGAIPVGGYKRSSSSLDALTGVTLGKRSAPYEMVNLEPALSRSYSSLRSPPRLYDMRWTPFDASEAPALNLDY